MKYALLFFFLWVQLTATGQNYSCISSEAKTYFTNSRGYLRGMRIDSVKYDSGNTLYYPFRTARLENCTWGPIADTLGGSWWGKVLVRTPQGTTWVQNKWGDTITIRNDANLNDSWVFYHDSTAVYYEAQVVAWDTMTFPGYIDSVKRIRLTAKNGTSVIPADPLNDLELVISKEHGLIQAIDLYLFPYHAPGDTIWSWSFDCYFFEANGGSSIISNNATLAFKRVAYLPPVSDEVYNHEVNDAFWLYETMDMTQTNYRTIETVTKVTDKIISDTLITYTINYWSKSKGHSPPTAYEYNSGTFSRSYARGKLLSDTLKMPEEWYGGHYYYYFPEDSSFCYLSPVYWITTDKIMGNGYYLGNAVEPSFPSESYKNHLGRLYWSTGGQPMLDLQRSISLVGAQKGGEPCDEQNGPVPVMRPQGADQPKLLVYPNPVDEHLEVRISNASVRPGFGLELCNSLGVVVLNKNYTTNSCVLSLGHLPAGLYFVKIYTEQGSASRKFTISR